MLRAGALCLALLMSAAWGAAHAEAAQRKFSAEFFDTFDTLVVFTAYAADEAAFERYAAAFHAEMTRLHRLFDIYHTYADTPNIAAINDSAGVTPVKVDADILDLLDFCIAACAETDGAVNVAKGAVFRLWHDCRERASAGEDAVPPTGGRAGMSAFNRRTARRATRCWTSSGSPIVLPSPAAITSGFSRPGESAITISSIPERATLRRACVP